LAGSCEYQETGEGERDYVAVFRGAPLNAADTEDIDEEFGAVLSESL
jgi:hypothetical protein